MPTRVYSRLPELATVPQISEEGLPWGPLPSLCRPGQSPAAALLEEIARRKVGSLPWVAERIGQRGQGTIGGRKAAQAHLSNRGTPTDPRNPPIPPGHKTHPQALGAASSLMPSCVWRAWLATERREGEWRSLGCLGESGYCFSLARWTFPSGGCGPSSWPGVGLYLNSE